MLLGSTVISVGIDATIRQWSLKPDELQGAVDQAKKAMAGEEEEQKPNPESMLTEEEEKELAELMDEE